MLQARNVIAPVAFAAVDPGIRLPLWTLIYHSRAVEPMTDLALRGLQERAQARNRSEGITGVVIYDAGHFYQCLEGPAESLERIWASVSRDPRHTDIELLGSHAVPTRSFVGWDMQLSNREVAAHPDGAPPAMPQAELIDLLLRRPHDARLLLSRHPDLTQTLTASDFPRFDHMRVTPRDRVEPLAMRRVVETLLVPKLVALLRIEPVPTPDGDNREAIEKLAQLLVANNDSATLLQIRGMQSEHPTAAALCESLLEPTARALGDLWQNDDCTEVEMTIGLCRLQSLLHDLLAGNDRAGLLGLPSVLVATQPGELHRLGAAMDAELLWLAGWQTQYEAPVDNTALESLVADHWFDALDLNLSPAFRREHWLPRMAVTIAVARRASLNRNLVIHVGGRVFHEGSGAGIVIGADVSSHSAASVGLHILEVLRGRG